MKPAIAAIPIMSMTSSSGISSVMIAPQKTMTGIWTMTVSTKKGMRFLNQIENVSLRTWPTWKGRLRGRGEGVTSISSISAANDSRTGPMDVQRPSDQAR
ncbi:MAG: hypothetical protein ACYSX0_14405 [Planctomycetota bacterium]|jgi:hypothetical protein